MGSVVSSENEGPPDKSCADENHMCRCGHPVWFHDTDHAGKCSRAGCGCQDFRPAEGGIATDPKGSASSSLDDMCKCGHARHSHEGEFRDACVECPAGMSTAWRHAFVPADAETAGEPEAPHEHDWSEWGAVYHGGDLQWRRCACGEEESRPDPLHDSSPCDGCGHFVLDHIDGACKAWDCPCGHPVPPPRRPPVAVAYELQDGTAFEIALPGDATVRSTDGVLIVMHSQSPVKGLVQYKPMEGQ